MGFQINIPTITKSLLASGLLVSQVACATDQPKWSNNNPAPYQSSHYYQDNNNPISIEVVDDSGRSFTKHQYRNNYKSHRAYLEAKKGQNYNLKVHNRSNKRIAVVIAVDGRNIISGKKSNLQNNERMYVLGPYKTATYKGWRTGQNKVNRFYFTDSGNSYAAAWGDHSAMGVIAAAVYEEKAPEYQPDYYSNKVAPSAKRRSATAEKAGTGYGREEHSASVRVNFRPKSAVAAKYFYKYEWRKTLCEHNVIQCQPTYYNKPDNRFWPYDSYNNNRGNGAYAPPPPTRFHWK